MLKTILLRFKFFSFLMFLYLCINSYAYSETTVNKLFTSQMVLQRGMTVPIWGKGKPNSIITVSFKDQTKTTKVLDDGSWRIKLDPIKIGKPDILTIKGTTEIILKDVQVGDVWLGSGQSNMETTFRRYKSDKILKGFITNPPPNLHIYNDGAWQKVTKGNVPQFSALLFAFGVNLQQSLKVPIGLICGAKGGSASGLWITQEMIEKDPRVNNIIMKLQEKFKLLNKDSRKVHWHKTIGNLGGLYKTKIFPFAGFAIKGVLWDQGESGVKIPETNQLEIMGLLIKGWRKDWDQDFPWVYIQKPSGGGCAWDYNNPIHNGAQAFTELPVNKPNSKKKMMRSDYIKIGNYKDAVIVPTSDLVPGLHPPIKSSYAQRAANVALGFVYNNGEVYHGPTYKSHEIIGEKIIVNFKNIGKGLAFKNGEKLQGFEISSDGLKWEWADSKIIGETVELTCENIKSPKAVRYAWAKNHQWANLFNKNGLPAFSFNSHEK